MTDHDENKFADLSDMDWDNALDAWEKQIAPAPKATGPATGEFHPSPDLSGSQADAPSPDSAPTRSSFIPPNLLASLLPSAQDQDQDPLPSTVLAFEGPTATFGLLPEDDDPTDAELPESEAVIALELWADERPASHWLREDVAQAVQRAATFLEKAAEGQTNKGEKGRTLLAASELRAIEGRTEDALARSKEARDLCPSHLLTHQQFRGLLHQTGATFDLLDTFDRQLSALPQPTNQVHCQLHAGELLRGIGDRGGASKRWSEATASATSEVSAYLVKQADDLSGAAPAITPWAPGEAHQDLLFRAFARARERRELAQGGGPLPMPAPSSLPQPSQVQGGLLRLHRALGSGDAAAIQSALAQLSKDPHLDQGAQWLQSAFASTSSPEGAQRSLSLLRHLSLAGDVEAPTGLAVRSLALGDDEALEVALRHGVTDPDDQCILQSMMRTPGPHQGNAPFGSSELFATALGAWEGNSAPLSWRGETSPTPSEPEKVMFDLGARLASGRTSPALFDLGLQALSASHKDFVAVCIELAVADRNTEAASRYLQDAPASVSDWAKALAAGLVAEAGDDNGRAKEAYELALRHKSGDIAVLRALASLNPHFDLASELNQASDKQESEVAAATMQWEAAVRAADIDDLTRAELFARADAACPELFVAGFLHEELSRELGHTEALVRSVQQRRQSSTDDLEVALETVREARLLAPTAPAASQALLQELQQSHPGDLSLAEVEPSTLAEQGPGRATLFELQGQRAEDASGKATFSTLAAYEYDRLGQGEDALRCARAAVASGASAALARSIVAKREPPRGTSEFPWNDALASGDRENLPALRALEDVGLGDPHEKSIGPVAAGISLALRNTDPVESASHALLAARAMAAAGEPRKALPWAEDAALLPDAALEAIRTYMHLARECKNDEAFDAGVRALTSRTSHPEDRAFLLVRMGEHAARRGDLVLAETALSEAVDVLPTDLVAWSLLAEVRMRRGQAKGTVEACVGLARASQVREHQLLAWFDAGTLSMDEVGDPDGAIFAFESAARIDITYADLFQRLAALYESRGDQEALSALVEQRTAALSDPREKATLAVIRAKLLVSEGEDSAAYELLARVTKECPDHAEALETFAHVSQRLGHWSDAEGARIQIARSAQTPEALARAYEHLGDLYLGPLQNPTRAETAFQEALRQEPLNTRILERLVALYEGTKDAPRAIQTKTKLVDLAEGDADRRLHLLGLARLHESLAHEPRRAEQILDQLRKSHPHDFEVLRALADFYHRQGQSGAARMLLDRVLSESRRHLQSSKFDESIFHTVAQVFEIRGQNDAKAMALACRSALHHGDATLEGLGPRTLSLDIDDFLAPPSASPSLRALLVQIGEHLDSCLAGPPGDMDGTPVAPESPLAKQLEELASAAGVGPVRIHRTSKLGASVLAVRSSPPFLLVGDVLADAPVAPATLFQLVRALKLVQLHAAALARSDGTTVEAALGAWLSTLVPTWTPKGGLSSSATQMAERMAQNLPAEIPDDIVSLAKETADQLQGPLASVGLGIRTLANRAGLVCLGDPGVCIDALARLQGLDPEASGFQRTSWLARHHEGRDLIVFGISDAYVALRAQLDHPREESAG